MKELKELQVERQGKIRRQKAEDGRRMNYKNGETVSDIHSLITVFKSFPRFGPCGHLPSGICLLTPAIFFFCKPYAVCRVPLPSTPAQQ